MRGETLGQALASRGEGKGFITFIEADNREQTYSYGELYQRAIWMLGRLQGAGLTPGDELVVCTSSNAAFVEVLWACLLGGIAPVPLAKSNAGEHQRKVVSVLATLRRPALFTDPNHLERLQGTSLEGGAQLSLASNRVFLREACKDGSPSGTPADAAAESAALIQFSSGSTGKPRGVVLSHKNLLTNIRAIIQAAGLSLTDSTLSWMPLTHDMGLIGFHLLPLVLGVPQFLLPPETFVRRPLLWLEKVSEKRVTLLGSPNFGYRHLLQALRKQSPASLDLSCVRLIFNGAEPISPELCEEFANTLSPFGLLSTSMFPVYGLAEASLAVSFPEPGVPLSILHADRSALGVGGELQVRPSASDTTLCLASVGKVIAGCSVRITDGMNKPLENGRIGHLQIQGDSISAGYYTPDGLARDGFSSDNWLDTGDLGVNVDDIGLFIVGRQKDTIIINGQNYHAHDLESICEGVEGVGRRRVVCAAVRNASAETDAFLVFVQHRASLEEFLALADGVALALAQAIGVAALEIVPVSSLPLTTSGKLKRFALREGYEEGAFRDVLESLKKLRLTRAVTDDEPTPTERILVNICSTLMAHPVGLEDNIIDLGADSLALATIMTAINDQFSDALNIEDFLDYPTIAALGAFLDNGLPAQPRHAQS